MNNIALICCGIGLGGGLLIANRGFISKPTQNSGKENLIVGIIGVLGVAWYFHLKNSRELVKDKCTYIPEEEMVEGIKDSLIPEEFRTLIHKVEKLNSFKTFDMSTVYHDCRSVREIVIGSNAGVNEIFIKRPTGKRALILEPYAKQEQLAFMINHRLNLGVVPPTMACKGYISILERTSKVVKSHLYIDDIEEQGVVIQEGVTLLSNQFHMKSDLISYCRLKEESVEKVAFEQGRRVISEFALDINNICQAIIFNVIAGRTDAGRRNSVIDSHSKIQEIDNEYIGDTKTDSWLLEVFSECILSRESVDNFLAIEDSVFENIFKELDSVFQPTLFFNEKDCEFNIVDKSKENITGNFKKLKEVILSKKGEDIKIKDLKTIFYVPNFYG